MLAAEEPNYISSLSTKYYPVSFTARAFSAAERKWMETHDTLRVGYLEKTALLRPPTHSKACWGIWLSTRCLFP